jgi:outer membrane biosynthesis protein TonB
MKPPQQLVRKLPKPTKVSSSKAPPPPVTKVQAPVRKVQEPTKVSSLKPPPLPLKKPQPPMHPRPSASVPRPGEGDEGRREVEVKFKAAQAKAKLGGVHTLTRHQGSEPGTAQGTQGILMSARWCSLRRQARRIASADRYCHSQCDPWAPLLRKF